MADKKVLRNYKRASVRLMDSIFGGDMGWWFCERPENLKAIRGYKTADDLRRSNAGLLEGLEWFFEEDEEKKCRQIARVNKFLARWDRKLS